MKNWPILLVTLTTIYALSANAHAVSIGAGPSTIDYSKLTKGGFSERIVTVSTSGQDDLDCTIEFTGDIKDWLTVDKGTKFTLPANSRQQLDVIIQPPLDAENGKYEGMMYIKAAPTAAGGGGAGLVVGAGVGIKISAEITGKEDATFTVKDLKVIDAEVGYPFKIQAIVLNTGNVRARPNFTVSVSDTSKNKVLSGGYSDATILPTQEEQIEFSTPSTGLASGQYDVAVDVYGRGELIYGKTLKLNMMPKGTLSVSGKLMEIAANTEEAAPGDMVKITATFRNTGQVPVNAKLKAEAYLKERLVSILPESDEIAVTPDATVSLETYYTAAQEGNYIIKGYVLFNGIKTETQGTMLRVKGGGVVTDQTTLIIAAIAVITLAVLAYLKFGRRSRKPPYPYYPPQMYPGQYQTPPYGPPPQQPPTQPPQQPTQPPTTTPPAPPTQGNQGTPQQTNQQK